MGMRSRFFVVLFFMVLFSTLGFSDVVLEEDRQRATEAQEQSLIFQRKLLDRTLQDRERADRERAKARIKVESESGDVVDGDVPQFNIDHIDPFFDHRLVEFMFRIPGELKINGGITKVLLRKAMKGILPEETRNRVAKTGWNAPAHLWFSTEKFSEELGDLINSTFFRNLHIYNIAIVQNLFDEHRKIVNSNENTENHMMFFWQMINLIAWIKSVE